MNNLKVLLVISLFTCLASAKTLHITEISNLGWSKPSVVYRDCGSKTGSIVSVDVTDCNRVPCQFQRGKNYTLTLKFKSNANSKTIVNHVYGVIAHVPIPFHLPNDNGCELGLTCPIKSGDTLTEAVTLPILDQYPKIGVLVKWVAVDDNNNNMICFEFPVQIQ